MRLSLESLGVLNVLSDYAARNPAGLAARENTGVCRIPPTLVQGGPDTGAGCSRRWRRVTPTIIPGWRSTHGWDSGQFGEMPGNGEQGHLQRGLVDGLRGCGRPRPCPRGFVQGGPDELFLRAPLSPVIGRRLSAESVCVTATGPAGGVQADPDDLCMRADRLDRGSGGLPATTTPADGAG
jgi:hypothetical protein